MLISNQVATASLTCLDLDVYKDHLWGWLMLSPSLGWDGSQSGRNLGPMVHPGKPDTAWLWLCQLSFLGTEDFTLGGSWLGPNNLKMFSFRAAIPLPPLNPLKTPFSWDRFIISARGVYSITAGLYQPFAQVQKENCRFHSTQNPVNIVPRELAELVQSWTYRQTRGLHHFTSCKASPGGTRAYIQKYLQKPLI